MTAQLPLRTSLFLTLAAALLMLQASCARSVPTDVDFEPPLFAIDAKIPSPLAVCIDTDCPAPWATCPDGGLCTTDTSRDLDHCGSCATRCPRPLKTHHASPLCTRGVCAFACDTLYADCNHQAADGCEVYTAEDPKNCGGCGVTCKADELCWRGACGCPKGFIQCGDECKDPKADNDNCGTCGKACVPPKNGDEEWLCGDNVNPPNTDWGCAGGACRIGCKAHFGDCNGNLCTDGCETDHRTDRLNCGTCGHVCDAGTDCVDGSCLCPPGTTRCGKRCVDVNIDPRNCGECGNRCPGPGGGEAGHSADGSPTCGGGVCGYTCFAGFADCDGKIFNGCEVNVANDPKHCGFCSTQCDASRGQPCVDGQCLTKKCEPGPGIY